MLNVLLVFRKQELEALKQICY